MCQGHNTVTRVRLEQAVALPKLHKWFHQNKERALDKKFLSITSPEPQVQIKNKFTVLFLMMPSTKIAEMVPLHRTKGLPEL